MSKSPKEKKYDNKTAEYVVGKASTKKPASIASEPEEVDENEDPKRIIGKKESANADY
jgi:hypothetical protein